MHSAMLRIDPSQVYSVGLCLFLSLLGLRGRILFSIPHSKVALLQSYLEYQHFSIRWDDWEGTDFLLGRLPFHLLLLLCYVHSQM